MAIDTRQKRMSAIAPRSPWRGALVDPTETGFNTGNRMAAVYLYSGIPAGPPVDFGPAGRLPLTDAGCWIGWLGLSSAVWGV